MTEVPECYQVLEMPLTGIHRNGIRMSLTELQRICKENHLLLFCLKVEETVHLGVSMPVHKPYNKYFTTLDSWMFYAVEKTEPESAIETLEPTPQCNCGANSEKG